MYSDVFAVADTNFTAPSFFGADVCAFGAAETASANTAVSITAASRTDMIFLILFFLLIQVYFLRITAFVRYPIFDTFSFMLSMLF